MLIKILGGYQTDFARNWLKEDVSIVEAFKECVSGALESSRLNASDIETIHVGNAAAELFLSQGHLGALAIEADTSLRGLPSARHEAACASGSIAALAASAEIEARRYEVALVIGIEQMKTVDPQKCGDFLGTAAWYEKEAKDIEFPFPKLFGKLGAEYIDRFNISHDYYSECQSYLSDLMFTNARLNQKAQSRIWDIASISDKLAARISPEITVKDCSQITDGAVAIIIASEQFAAKYAQNRGINLDSIPSIKGWGHTTAPIALSDKLSESRNTRYVLPHARKAIMDAYYRAGIAGHSCLDSYEFHDCFTTTSYASIDLVGLTKPGQNHVAIEKGWIEKDGLLPLNPSGGLIGAGHPVGATGVRQLLDSYLQISEKAGSYQVELKNKNVLAVNIGGSGTTTVATVIGKNEL
ncbi:MAG: acetyl-CoA acetyltransferase [Dehalococcoidia bacterium]|nr:acetyl-CoA acetyltransferase [Dehalococcoidia bacterium]|tara:strand:- start:26706 stop:27941 length:1236 start_codon:yes stop_codon:yes gene_type:complete